MSKDELTIRELEKLSGYSARSIHHYISRGLLPNPEGSGPAARYGRRHLLRLMLIQQAKRAGFKIDQRLQDLLDGLSLEELEQLAAMSGQASPEDVRTFGEWLMTGDYRTGRSDRSAKALAKRLPSTAAMLGGKPKRGRVRSLMADALDDAGKPSTYAGSPGLDYKVQGAQPERWERMRFGDSVEISWKASGRDPRLQRKVEELLRQAQTILGDDD